MTISLSDRFEGALTGVLAGDALGAPYEKWEPEAIRSDFWNHGGLVPFSYDDPWGKDGVFPPGLPTDDSELTAALAESLVSRNACDPSDQYLRFKSAVHGTSTLHERPTHGFGRTTRLMLRPDSYEESQQNAHLYLRATNGSLMRSAPLALFFRGDLDAMLQATAASSRVTHGHETAIECCQAFVLMLDAELSSSPRETVWRAAQSIEFRDPELLDLLIHDVPPEPSATNAWPPSGGALHTFQIAVWASYTAETFRDGIELAVLKGGDTDTAAAVTGALLGARYGIDGIPRDWRDVLMGAEKMSSLAQALYALNQKRA